MNPHPSIETRVRAALAERADEIEPTHDAYARLARRVTAAPRPVRWWRTPRALWFSTAGIAAAALVLVVVLVSLGDSPEANFASTPTPLPEESSASPTTPPRPSAVAWPLGTPAEGWPTSAEEAARRFYAEVLGVGDVPVGPGPLSGRESVSVFRRDEAGQPTDIVASVVIVERVGPNLEYFGVTEVLSDDVVIDAVSSAPGIVTIDGRARFEGTVIARLFSDRDLAEPTPAVAGAKPELRPFVVELPTLESGPAMAIVATGGGADTDVPSVGMRQVDLVTDTRPLGYDEAAIDFVVDKSGGYELTVLDSVAADNGHVLVSLGYAAGTADPEAADAVVTQVDVAPDGAGGWRAAAAANDSILVNEAATVSTPNGLAVRVNGRARTTTGELSIELLDTSGTRSGFALPAAGQSRLRAFEVDVVLTAAEQGPGHVVLFDSGETGELVSLTIVAIDLPKVDATEGGTTCSAAGMDVPPAQPDLPEAVANTRDAIIAAALACDLEALTALVDPDGFTASFGGGTPRELWPEAEAQGGEPLRWMVNVLSLPHGTIALVEGGSAYSWPSAFGPAWADLTPAEIDTLRPFFDQTTLNFFAEFGGYVGYRVGITAAGKWVFFVAGD